eukprot:jgi/Chrpa1/27788/Chrysochromulina_OHIO_Genome00007721-RA
MMVRALRVSSCARACARIALVSAESRSTSSRFASVRRGSVLSNSTSSVRSWSARISARITWLIRMGSPARGARSGMRETSTISCFESAIVVPYDFTSLPHSASSSATSGRSTMLSPRRQDS